MQSIQICTVQEMDVFISALVNDDSYILGEKYFNYMYILSHRVAFSYNSVTSMLHG